jgi:plastocyanin
VRARIGVILATVGIAAVAALLPASAGAQTTHEVGVIEDDPELIWTWSPDELQIDPGDTVSWYFDPTVSPGGPITAAHNVYVYEGDDATGPLVTNSGLFTPSDPGPPFEYTFNEVGRYFYLCTIHADSMRGDLQVGEPGGNPDLRLSAQPRRDTVKPGKRATFAANLRNAGAGAANQVRICAKAPRKLVTITGNACRSTASLGVGRSIAPRFTIKPRPRARGKSVRISFTATAANAEREAAAATLKVKRR